jgi:crossover junction endodeoxyribonuclease RuvC
MTIILGIDPGSRTTGFGLIHMNTKTRHVNYLASGCIKTTSEMFLVNRLGLIYKGIEEIIATHRPHHVAIEQVFLKHNVMSALKLGHARGAAMAACAMFDLTVSEYSPRAIKQAVVGYGGAEKLQVQKMIVELLRLNKSPSNDAADALAVAVCHGFHQSMSYSTTI